MSCTPAYRLCPPYPASAKRNGCHVLPQLPGHVVSRAGPSLLPVMSCHALRITGYVVSCTPAYRSWTPAYRSCCVMNSGLPVMLCHGLRLTGHVVSWTPAYRSCCVRHSCLSVMSCRAFLLTGHVVSLKDAIRVLGKSHVRCTPSVKQRHGSGCP